jgi:lipopolysaccharide/colanic/teichoic acid biosynthesis glycosyltransferase
VSQITNRGVDFLERLAQPRTAVQPLSAPTVRPASLKPPEGLPYFVDAILAMGLLVVTMPLMLLFALMIKLDSPGPALFRQSRLGLNRRRSDRRRCESVWPRVVERREGERRQIPSLPGRPFNFYKFRTMRHDARKKFPELYAYDYKQEDIAQIYFKRANDPRLTRVGYFLRQTSLDELPNLWNVVRGDMSLVGPRPEIPEMARYYRPEQLAKFTVKPGVTGEAQTSGRGLLTFGDTVTADLIGVARKSAWYDLKLLFRTLLVIVKRTGAF